MGVPSLILAEPLTQEKLPSRKMIVLMSFLTGLGCALFFLRGEQETVLGSSISVAVQPMCNRLQTTHPSKILASLPGSPTAKQEALRAIEANSGRCFARDVSVKAEATEKMVTAEQLKEMPGVTAPLGFWDPVGFTTNFNCAESQILFYREAELKHGRVCMLAVLGIIVGERHDFIPLLGSGLAKDVPPYLLATPFVEQTSVAQFWPLALGAVAIEEWRRVAYNNRDILETGEPLWKSKPKEAPGDYGWDPLGLKPKDPKAFKELQNKELNNGRLAMFAAAGIIAQEQLTGKNILFR